MVAKVQQQSRYTCVLACLESVASDMQLPWTQLSLVTAFPDDCNTGVRENGRDITGSVPLLSGAPLSALEKHPGFFRLVIKSGIGRARPPGEGAKGLTDVETEFRRGSPVLVMPLKDREGNDCRHCVRLVDFECDDHLEVMNPIFRGGLVERWPWTDLDDRDCQVVLIE